MTKIKLELQLKENKVFKCGYGEFSEAYLVLDKGIHLTTSGADIPYAIYSKIDRKGTSFKLASGNIHLFVDGANPTYENETIDNTWHKDMTEEEITALGKMLNPKQDPLNQVLEIIGVNYDADGIPFVFVRDIPAYKTKERIYGFVNLQDLVHNEYMEDQCKIGDLFEFIVDED